MLCWPIDPLILYHIYSNQFCMIKVGSEAHCFEINCQISNKWIPINIHMNYLWYVTFYFALFSNSGSYKHLLFLQHYHILLESMMVSSIAVLDLVMRAPIQLQCIFPYTILANPEVEPHAPNIYHAKMGTWWFY